MLILPAIDLIDGKAVRLFQGDYSKKTVYNDDPVAVAQSFKDAGATMIHIVDLDGAKAGTVQNKAVIAQIIEKTGLKIQVGGGIRTLATMRELRHLGVDQLIIGTIALEDKPLLQAAVDEMAESVTVSLDAKNGTVYTRGWLEATDANVLDVFREMETMGISRFIYTDIVKDGTNTEPNYAVIEEIVKTISGNLIVAGGVSAVQHIKQLNTIGVYGAIIGRALYEGHINLKEALEYAD